MTDQPNRERDDEFYRTVLTGVAIAGLIGMMSFGLGRHYQKGKSPWTRLDLTDEFLKGLSEEKGRSVVYPSAKVIVQSI